MNKKLSFLTILIAILAILSGLLSLDISSFSILNFIVPAIYIIAGVGLLLKKFWAVRIMQGLIIIAIFSSFTIFLMPEQFLHNLILFLICISLFTAILMYLKKEKVVAQFIDLDSNVDNLEINKKELTSLMPVLRTIIFLAYWLFVISLFVMAMSYAFEWWGNWAYLLILGLIFPIIPFSELLSSVVLFPPIFIVIFWFYEGTFPWMFIGLSVLCIVSQYVLAYLDFKGESGI
jgi:hypothetical protein